MTTINNYVATLLQQLKGMAQAPFYRGTLFVAT
jgi:hypothetical protein